MKRATTAIFAALAAFLMTGCTGLKYITTDLRGKSVVIVKSGWGVDLSVGAVTDTGAPLSVEAGRIATVYVSSKDGDKLPPNLADIIRAARGDIEITATGIREGAAPAAK
jgi:hypothetical protein